MTVVAISLAGCSSYSSMTNVFIFGLMYANTTRNDLDTTRKNTTKALSDLKGSSQLEVRTGYFGMCVNQHGVLWVCSNDADALAQQIGPGNDPLDLIGTASQFKNNVLFSGVLLMALILALFSAILLATFPGRPKERTGSDVDFRPFPFRIVAHYAMTGAFAAAVLLLIAGLWQHVGSVGAAAVADIANSGNVSTAIGGNAMILVWTSVFIETIVAAGTMVTIISLISLESLTDND